MLIELLRQQQGKNAELLRRWCAALLIAPAEERSAIVEAVERRIVETYAPGPPAADPAENDERLVHLARQPRQQEGHTEIVVRTFAAETPPDKPGKTRASARRRA